MFNPDAMLAAMPHRIFEEWMRYDEAEPFGQLSLRIGFAAAALGNLLGKPKGKRAWQPSDFMPDMRKSKRDTSPDNQVGQIYAIAKMFGSEIKDPKGLLKRYD